MSTTRNDAARKPWTMWLEITLIIAVLAVLRFTATAVDGVPGLLLGFLGAALLIALYWRCGVWAERVARQKNIYHPQYFVLGPLGLVMALCAKDKSAR
ncbi:hypothetical protein GCM10029976_097680 [Kribbella albertanoniae]|uniref:Uncharacterized protein n=1 Tax=Kribbella albertanoniae TaxID=1266829 RepID=A0A4V2XSC8_9ACTN|nr:hypothetical protein [Kribbella albertanoniae]TDC33285.1 hypothetical protein E1261_06390 [Kribbella albertanoniae]